MLQHQNGQHVAVKRLTVAAHATLIRNEQKWLPLALWTSLFLSFFSCLLLDLCLVSHLKNVKLFVPEWPKEDNVSQKSSMLNARCRVQHKHPPCQELSLSNIHITGGQSWREFWHTAARSFLQTVKTVLSYLECQAFFFHESYAEFYFMFGGIFTPCFCEA